MRSDDGNEVFFSARKKQYRLVKWEVFYRLKPWFEVIGFFIVFSFFLFLCVFCLDGCSSVILMMDNSALR